MPTSIPTTGKCSRYAVLSLHLLVVFTTAQYPDAPNTWYFGLIVPIIGAAFMINRMLDSTLPWCVSRLGFKKVFLE